MTNARRYARAKRREWRRVKRKIVKMRRRVGMPHRGEVDANRKCARAVMRALALRTDRAPRKVTDPKTRYHRAMFSRTSGARRSVTR